MSATQVLYITEGQEPRVFNNRECIERALAFEISIYAGPYKFTPCTLKGNALMKWKQFQLHGFIRSACICKRLRASQIIERAT